MDKSLILIVDDDTRLRQLLKAYLERNDFAVAEAENALHTEDLLKYLKPDAIVMDVMMPQKNGDILTKELRAKGITTPILMLTAKGDTNSRIIGLEAGADDYLPKPFEPKELLLRLNNLLKRQTGSVTKYMTFGPYQYFPQTGLLKNQETQISLTSAEKTLLDMLVSHLNQEVSRDQLTAALNIENERTVDVQITRLRKKIDPNNHFIQTIRGKGYRLISA